MRAILPLLCAGLLTACGTSSFEEKPLEEIIAGTAQFINTDGQRMLPDLPGNVAAVAEGDTLVMRITNLPIGGYTYNEQYLRREMRPFVCDLEGNRYVIDRGGKFRVEMVSNTGVASPPVTFARCT
ncbi:hypothetical protein [Alteraurantiacibacter aquimixticola]|uniref:Uncharacterized protein n=1 Tax=Alteraurantiacibacter aquimixticola TaxID=2489173 RepID=A0A4T3F0G5_9SPHN|nr:hypothetical protein [Alteraurantiacibacter aquimixticola]TIX48832.1 hypothetical protein E5222_13885 [Alteraurantiacibacter aquimixticola]